ncbi:MAG TPA: adenylate/guanylate cyclase domain-containing protein [Spirochaetota bacterium]|nr:adenylate/guanylate cyclase domain-containing protein [Spirochaetota bacterium]
MKRLKENIETNTHDYSSRIEALEPGIPTESMAETVAKRIMNGSEFQSLSQILRRIRYSSRSRLPEEGFLKPIPRDAPDQPVIKFAYMHFAIKESTNYEVVRWLADADYDAPGEEVAVGSLYRVPQLSVREAFQGKLATEKMFVQDKWGPSLTAAFPISDERGQVIAVVGLDMNVTNEANRVDKLWIICMTIIVFSVVLSAVLTFVFTRLLVRPIAALREGAERVRARDFSTSISIKNRDELGILAETFNSMVIEIRDYAEDLERLNKAYYRFVPREFLEFLGRAAITDIKLGDQTLKEMSILFSDIRSFTTLSESMTPEENFNFLNQYLKNVGPAIRESSGFIDKYIGDAVMALFPNKAADAVRAALMMRRELAKFNAQRSEDGLPEINIGIGIHTGMMMLGTIGEEERMESTVISDSVNLASRLEGLTKQFGAPVIISEHTYNKLGEFEKNICIRPLGRVYVKGKKASVSIFEIVDKESDKNALVKLETLDDFSLAVRLFAKGQHGEAEEIFKRIKKKSPDDLAVLMYLKIISGKEKSEFE